MMLLLPSLLMEENNLDAFVHSQNIFLPKTAISVFIPLPVHIVQLLRWLQQLLQATDVEAAAMQCLMALVFAAILSFLLWLGPGMGQDWHFYLISSRSVEDQKSNRVDKSTGCPKGNMPGLKEIHHISAAPFRSNQWNASVGFRSDTF